MYSILLSFILAGAAIVLAAPSTVDAPRRDSWEECEARMNGELPYYVPTGFNFSGNVRRYYVAAELVTWDYAPSGMMTLVLLSLQLNIPCRLGQLAWRPHGGVLPGPDSRIHPQ